MQLADVDYKDGRKETIILLNKFDKISDTNEINSYEKIRRMQQIQLIEAEGRDPVFIDYSDVAQMYKQSMSKEQFKEYIKRNLL